MSLFDWQAWRERLGAKDAQNKQTERWYLQKLHGPNELSELAFLVAKRLAAADLPAKVQVQSVWIDALPQAVGRAMPLGFEAQPAELWPGMHLEPVKCELADLLYVVKIIDYSSVQERAVLLQGKMSEQANRLPGGSSTRTERALLERHLWTVPIELYRSHTAAAGSFIGRYLIGPPGVPGLMDFARYLLIAKTPAWKVASPLSPYAVGWPEATHSPYLRAIDHVDLAQCAVDMAGVGAMVPGRPVGFGGEWDNLVYALRNGNSARHFKGYGGQPYVRNSEIVDTREVRARTLMDWVEKALHHPAIDPRRPVVEWSTPFAWHVSRGKPPEPPQWSGDEEPGGFPMIPVITVSITKDGEWRPPMLG